MKLSKTILILSFFLFLFSLIFTTSTDFSQDLGRHLKLGEIIVRTHKIPGTNLFSYTNPNFQFINHHWLSEVFFYLLTYVFGLNSLLYLKAILILASLIIIFKLAVKKSGVIPLVISGLIFAPLLLERNDIRPEIFGYFFFSVVLYILFNQQKNKKLLYLLPVIMILWINIHISFIFGVFLILLLVLKIYLNNDSGRARMTLVLILSLVLLIINPHGLRGIFYPLNIFKNYGYTIVENQNIFYLKSMIFNPLLNYYFLLIPIILIIILVSMYRYIEVLLLLTFSTLTIFQWRHLPFFALTAMPVAATVIGNLQSVISKKIKINETIKLLLSLILILICTISSIFFVTNQYYLIFDSSKKFGAGYTDSGEKAVDFVLNNNLPKNIFNNFDIGGYLIYKLYPKYQVFIDNRPEAYPAEFIENVYKQMQIDKNIRDKIFRQYNINTIIFSHTDQTQWGEIFLRDIFTDKSWHLVYLDTSIVVLTKTKNLTDIREKKDFFETLVKDENNYLNLLILSRLFNFMNQNQLSEEAISKAKDLNPISCSIKKYDFRRFQQRPNFYYYKANELKKNSWYCF